MRGQGQLSPELSVNRDVGYGLRYLFVEDLRLLNLVHLG
jgi:hypothetical protein